MTGFGPQNKLGQLFFMILYVVQKLIRLIKKPFTKNNEE